MFKFWGDGSQESMDLVNAIPKTLKVADEITLPNEEDGVAEWLERHCL